MHIFKILSSVSKPYLSTRGQSLDSVHSRDDRSRQELRRSIDPSTLDTRNFKLDDFFQSHEIRYLNQSFLSKVGSIAPPEDFTFQLGARLGVGAQGEVFVCIYNGIESVAKRVSFDQHQILKTEAAFLCLLSEQYPEESWFSKPIAFFIDQDKAYLVMTNLGRTLISDDFSYGVIDQFLNILIKLELARVIHGDIKPGNVLTQDLRIAFCDFGLGLNKRTAIGHYFKLMQELDWSSESFSDSLESLPEFLKNELSGLEYFSLKETIIATLSHGLVMPVGTPNYIAPHIIGGDGMYFTSYGGDRFSVGSVLFELVFPKKRLSEHYFSDTHSEDPVAYLCSMIKNYESSYNKISLNHFGSRDFPQTVDGLIAHFNSESCKEKNPLLFFMHLMVHPDLNFMPHQQYLELFHALIQPDQFIGFKEDLIKWCK